MRIVSSLRGRIILTVTAILAATIGLGTWINIRYQQLHMEQALKDNALIIANTIERSLATAMLDGKSREVQSILENADAYHGIGAAAIFSPRGVILKSSKRWMIGRRIDADVEALFSRGEVRKPVARRSAGVLSVLFPLSNEERCRRCHGSRATLNGVLLVDVSLSPIREKVQALSRTMVLWAVGVTAILAAALSLFLTRRVTNPIRDLITVMEKAERGLEARAEITSTDDIGRLAAAFNSLLAKLDRARRRVERYHYEQMKRADRLASIGEMAAGIAHEIKNPLAGIAGVIQVLRRDAAGDEQKRAVLDEVLSQVERMDKAVRNLLSFARPPDPQMTRTDINELIGRMLDFLAPQFEKGGITAVRRLTPSAPWLPIDSDLVQQAFVNIALNAIQAMPGGGTLTVETRVAEPGPDSPGTVEIVFSDTGRGISSEHQSRIFTPFYTTRQQGTGLGLSIAQRIIEQHGGDIHVSSAPDRGASFTIVFPYPRAGRE